MNKYKILFRYHYTVVKNRIVSLGMTLFLAIIAFSSILIIELCLGEIPAVNALCYKIGKVYLSICYSFLSAIVFYFIVVHVPKENRKANMYRFLNNKINSIDIKVRTIVSEIGISSLQKLDVLKPDENKIVNACNAINPQKALVTHEKFNRTYSDWFDFLLVKNDEIEKLIVVIVTIDNSIDRDILKVLTYIEDITYKIGTRVENKPGNQDLFFISRATCNIQKTRYYFS